MAIKIPSANIYNRNINKINNKINKVSYTENNLVGENGNIFSSNFSIYASTTGGYSNNINDYSNEIYQNEHIPNVSNTPFKSGNYEYNYAYFKILNIEYPKINKKEDLSLVVGRTGVSNNSSLSEKKLITNNTTSGEYHLKEYSSYEAFEDETFYMSNNIGNVKQFVGYAKVGVVLRDNNFDVLILLKTRETSYANVSTPSYSNIQQSYDISLSLKLYNKSTVNKGTDSSFDFGGNELLSSTTKVGSYGIGEVLSNGIIAEYKDGKQTAEVVCTIADYYDYDTNEKVISPNAKNLLNDEKYSQLWNATYENGIVRQVEADYSPNVPTPLFNIIPQESLKQGLYMEAIDGLELLSGVNEGEKAIIYYKVNGIAKHTIGYVATDRTHSLRSLYGKYPVPEKAEEQFIKLLEDENGFIGCVIDLNYNTVTLKKGGCGVICQGFGVYSRYGDGSYDGMLPIEITSISCPLFQLQGMKNGNYTVDALDRKNVYSSRHIALKFTKTDDFSHIRFKLNGKMIDTGISFDVSDLENGKTYFFHANVNIDGGQGSVYWNEMQITRQARVKGYDKYGLPMAFQLYDEVVPMVMRADGEDYPLSVDASGNAKVFKVLGINIYFDGAIWQKLSLQEC